MRTQCWNKITFHLANFMWQLFLLTTKCILCTAFTRASNVSAGVFRTARNMILQRSPGQWHPRDRPWTLGNHIAKVGCIRIRGPKQPWSWKAATRSIVNWCCSNSFTQKSMCGGDPSCMKIIFSMNWFCWSDRMIKLFNMWRYFLPITGQVTNHVRGMFLYDSRDFIRCSLCTYDLFCCETTRSSYVWRL